MSLCGLITLLAGVDMKSKTLLKDGAIALLVKPLGKSKPVRCGYGKCSSSGCNCQKYEGNGNTCGNSGCGHGYDRHW